MTNMCVYEEGLEAKYEGRRYEVDGDLIDDYAREYWSNQDEVARLYHAEPLGSHEEKLPHARKRSLVPEGACDAIKRENDSIRAKVAQLDAECDQLMRINRDLHWQLGVSRKAYGNKLDHIAELAGLVVRLYERLDLECPPAADEYGEQVRRWVPLARGAGGEACDD